MLRQYLKTTIELPESEIQGTIDSHLKILDEIGTANKKKAEAAANEEFEEAVQYKNKVI